MVKEMRKCTKQEYMNFALHSELLSMTFLPAYEQQSLVTRPTVDNWTASLKKNLSLQPSPVMTSALIFQRKKL